MDLLRHWRRGTFGMAAGALVVPGAILLAALAVGIGGGGIAGLGALGQALNGPDLPDAAPAAQERSRDSGRLLARVNRRAAAQAQAAAPVRRATGGGPVATTGQPAPRGRFTPSGGEVPGGATPPAATAPPTVAPPAPTPTPESAVRQVGDTVTTVTDQVPVVGPTTSQVVDTVVDTVDSIIPPR
jgi:hypothetical protein